ncbi:S53 family peptidase [Paraburkholderia youngii]|uniref:Kumamolisin n=1 Tax=Paraburkholderia youngii TaxID=2782701 RepID=A0A7W8L9M1_9BURK|nr:S53 family peptidase [Paraburkholderia youngii]MBB5402655.1 kumamolisin [Paraburkholderia youngii]
MDKTAEQPSGRIAIRGSNRVAVPGATKLRGPDPSATIRLSIFARRNPHPSPQVLEKAKALDTQAVATRTYLSNDEFNEVYGASADDLAAIEKFAEIAGLRVIDASIPKRRVLVEGTIASIEKAFGVQLGEFEHPELGRFRGREGQVYVPDDMYSVIAAVEGMDTRPVGRPRRACTHFGANRPAVDAATALTNEWPGTFFPRQIAALYDFPVECTGQGQNIAVFAFNGQDSIDPNTDPRGGYSEAALERYFTKALGGQMPSITPVVVQGPGNAPGPDSPQSSRRGDSTGEVMLDLCVVGALVPDAKIFVYFTEFSSQGWTEAISQAITDENQISVISISYGNPESDPSGRWTDASVKVVNDALQAARSKGITVCVASGDDGSRDDASSGAQADFPASSPWVLAVGGTTLKATAGPMPRIASEVVWNDYDRVPAAGAGGGGISGIFGLPPYQEGIGVPVSVNPPHNIGRGVPDVAAVADPYTGVVVMHVSGQHLEPIGGTSASAPLWASLIVRINQALGTRVGFLNPTLYASCASGVLNDITVGNNGAYAAGVGWDACTGLGTPSGNKLLHALKTAPAPT